MSRLRLPAAVATVGAVTAALVAYAGPAQAAVGCGGSYGTYGGSFCGWDSFTSVPPVYERDSADAVFNQWIYVRPIISVIQNTSGWRWQVYTNEGRSGTIYAHSGPAQMNADYNNKITAYRLLNQH